MGSAAPSEPVLQEVAWLSLGMLVLALMLLLQILALRLRLVTRTKREQHFLATWKPLMAATIAGESVELPPIAKGDELFFLKQWNHLQESLRGDAKMRLNELAKRCGALPYVYHLLRMRGLRPRLIALTTLGNLADRSAWHNILRLAAEPDPLVSLAAARALLLIDAETALGELLPQLIEREDWPVAQLAILIKEARTTNSFTLLTKATSRLAHSDIPTEQAQLKRLLHLLEVAHPQQVLPLVRDILSAATDAEVIAQCLKFLSEPADLPAVYHHLEHQIWFVRMQAARALGRIGTTADLLRLAKLLSDPVWWVRYRTAQALLSLTHGDTEVLSRLCNSLTDRYAHDMLTMAMAEQVAP